MTVLYHGLYIRLKEMIVGTTILVIIFAEQLFCLDRYD